MKKLIAVAALAMALVAPAMAVNLVTNGDFSAGTAGWTNWICPWASGTNTVDASSGALELNGQNASFGVVQAIATVPGMPYTITMDWKSQGNPSSFWNEVLFFNDDGRAIYDQLDAPANSSVLSKVDGWGMNPPATYGWKSPFAGDQWFPSGPHTNTIIATGTTMYVGLKAGTVSGAPGGVDVLFDNVSVTPEPATMSLLALGGLALLRRRR